MLSSCGGGGGGGSDDYEAPVAERGSSGGETSVPATTVSGGITGSEVFIAGRTVEIWAKWCSDHEVTQAEYNSVMESNPSYFSGDSRPVEQVSWYDAIMYCNERSKNENLTPCYAVDGKTDTSQWGYTPHADGSISGEITCNFNANGYRLPTEAEWEYFARGGNTSNSGQTTYSGSNTIGEVAWYYDNACAVSSSSPDYGTHQIKTTSKANALDLYDMSGNVWEWCWDWYGSISASTGSTGGSSGSYRVYRGGSWNGDADRCSVAYRNYYGPYGRNILLGFRVVRAAD